MDTLNNTPATPIKKKKPTNLGVAGGALVGIGLGSYALGKGLIPNDAERAKLQPLLDLNTRLDAGGVKPENMEREYVDAASTAATVKPFGIPVASFMKTVRSAPGTPQSWKWNDHSTNHYNSFASGPLHGYLQHIRENQGVNGIADRLSDRLTNTSTAYSKSLFNKDLTGLDVTQQRKVMDGLNSQIKDPATLKQKTDADMTLGQASKQNAKNYGWGIQKGVAVSNAAKATGIGLMAVGAGMGLYALIKHLKGKKTKPEEPEQAVKTAAAKLQGKAQEKPDSFEIPHSGYKTAHPKHAARLLRNLMKGQRNLVMPWRSGRKVTQPPLEKEADALQDVKAVADQPMPDGKGALQAKVIGTLAGTALGAMVGGLLKKKNRTKGALLGAGIGGLAGFVGGTAYATPQITRDRAKREDINAARGALKQYTEETQAQEQQNNRTVERTNAFNQAELKAIQEQSKNPINLLDHGDPVRTTGFVTFLTNLASKAPGIRKIPGVAKIIGSSPVGVAAMTAMNYEKDPSIGSASLKEDLSELGRPWYQQGDTGSTKSLKLVNRLLNVAMNSPVGIGLNGRPGANPLFAFRTAANTISDVGDAQQQGGGSLEAGFGKKIDAEMKFNPNVKVWDASDPKSWNRENWDSTLEAAQPAKVPTMLGSYQKSVSSGLENGVIQNDDLRVLDKLNLSDFSRLRSAWTRPARDTMKDSAIQQDFMPRAATGKLQQQVMKNQPASDFSYQVASDGATRIRDQKTNLSFHPSNLNRFATPEQAQDIKSRSTSQGHSWFNND